ncbi:MAG: RNA methyltransferase [Fibrobacterales bacterium]
MDSQNDRPQNKEGAPLKGRKGTFGRAKGKFDGPKNDGNRPPQKVHQKREEGEEDLSQNTVAGIHAVESLLKEKPQSIHRIIFQLNSENPRLYSLQKEAKSQNIHVQQLQEKMLSNLYRNHQGVIAICHERELDEWSDVKEKILNVPEGKKITIVVAANIEDPRNLGAIMRSSLALNATALLLPGKGTCALTPAASKSAAGSMDKLIICRVKDFENELKTLKAEGFGVYGLDGSSKINISDITYADKSIMIIGGEDKGLPPHMSRACTNVLKIPMSDRAQSFNASVALSIALYEIERSRM